MILTYEKCSEYKTARNSFGMVDKFKAFVQQHATTAKISITCGIREHRSGISCFFVFKLSYLYKH